MSDNLSMHIRHSRNGPRKRNHSANRRRNVNSPNARSERNSPECGSDRPTLTTLATGATATTATIMAAFPTSVTVPILATNIRSTWGIRTILVDTTDSNTAAIRLGTIKDGQLAGTTTTIVTWYTRMAAIFCMI